MEININGNSSTFYGTLVCVSADNLASQMLGGYKQLASSIRKCRFCMATGTHVQEEVSIYKYVIGCPKMYAPYACMQFNPDKILPRTRDHYNEICDMLESYSDLTTRKELSKVYGIVYRAGLNKIQHFHVIDGLPPDIMHDLLEGAVPCEVKCLLQRYIFEEKIFTLAFINSRLKFYQ